MKKGCSESREQWHASGGGGGNMGRTTIFHNCAIMQSTCLHGEFGPRFWYVRNTSSGGEIFVLLEFFIAGTRSDAFILKSHVGKVPEFGFWSGSHAIGMIHGGWLFIAHQLSRHKKNDDTLTQGSHLKCLFVHFSTINSFCLVLHKLHGNRPEERNVCRLHFKCAQMFPWGWSLQCLVNEHGCMVL